MEDSKSKMDPDALRDPVAGWAAGEYIRALRPKVEELDKACVSVRVILYDLRLFLKKE